MGLSNRLNQIDERFSFPEMSTLDNPEELTARCIELEKLIACEIIAKVKSHLETHLLPQIHAIGMDFKLEQKDNGSLWLTPFVETDPRFLAVDILVSGHFGKLPDDEDAMEDGQLL